jgi:hypothetical protein
LLETFPVERKFLSFGGKLIVPISESVRGFLLNVLCEQFKALDFDQLLDRVPGKVWQPFLKWIDNVSLNWASQQEAHLLGCVFNLDDLLLHDSEDDHAQEDLLVFLEESTRDPLIDGHSDLFS